MKKLMIKCVILTILFMKGSSIILKKLKDKKLLIHLLINYFIILVPPVIAAYLLDVNDNMTLFFEEVVGYSVGISGFIVIVMVDSAFNNIIIAGLIFFLIKLIISFLVYIAIYHKLKKAQWLSFLLSTILSMWGIAFGVFWMITVMQ